MAYNQLTTNPLTAVGDRGAAGSQRSYRLEEAQVGSGKANKKRRGKRADRETDERADRETDARTPSRIRSAVRLMLLLALTVVAAIGISSGLVWWQERPLAEAELALGSEDPETALTLATRFLRSNPTNSRAIALRARALVATGKPAEAIELFEQIGPASEADLHAFAHALLMQQQWSQAEPLLVRVLQVNPDNSDALYEIAAARVRLGKLEEAVESARRFSELPGNEARGNVFVGTIHGDRGNFREAAEAYGRVLEHRPDASDLQVSPADFFQEYGRTLLRTGNPSDALENLNRSLRLSRTAETLTLQGNALEELGRGDEASEAWQAALAEDHAHLPAREKLAAAALGKGDAEQALRWLNPTVASPNLNASTSYLFQRAHTLRKNQSAAEMWRQRTERLREQEKLDSAINNLMVESPLSFWAKVVRAHRFAEAGNWSQAETLVAELMRTNASDPFLLDLKTAVQNRSGLPPLSQLPIQQF